MNTRIPPVAILRALSLSTAAVLAFAAWTAAAAGAAASAAGAQDLGAIEAAALDHAERQFGRSGLHFRALPLDPRLQLDRCPAPLQAAGGRSSAAQTAIRVSCPGANPWRVYVRVEMRHYGTVVVASRHLAAGTALSAADLRVEQRDVSQLRSSYATALSQLQGRRLRRQLRAGEVVPLQALQREFLVRNGDPVTIVSGGSDYRVSMRGTALRDGGMGSRVSVRNASSGRILDARVIDRGTVQVGPGPDLSDGSDRP